MASTGYHLTHNKPEPETDVRESIELTDSYAASRGNEISGSTFGAEGLNIRAAGKVDQRSIHWRAPTLIIGLFLCGVASAIGHHVYYQSLKGTFVASETRQQWEIRIGTGLAFLTKTALAASVGATFTQRLWITMRKRPIKLHAIDNLFSLTYDPTSFFNWEACRKAKTLFVLALIMWCIPLSATVTPSTLSVRSRMTPKDITASVASNILNDTGTRAYLWADWPGVGRFGSVSPHVNRLLAATSSSGSILQLTPPSPNATYTLDFHAPSFKCENLSIALASHSNNDNSSELTTAWNSAMGKLRSLAVYTGAESRGSTQKYFFINLNGKSGQNITCRPWNTSYTTNFNWVNGVQTLTITNLTHIDVLNKRTDTIYTDFAPGEIASLSITEALMGLLTTEIGYGANGNLYGADTLLPKTGIFACPEIANSMTNNNNFGLQNSPYDCRNGSVLKTIEDLSHNFTLSLLSSSLLTERTDTVVHILEARNVYAYNRTVLVSVYGGCAFIVLLCVCVGLRSLFKNGYSANMSFSSIMLTTRDSCPELARVAADYRLPADSLHKELGDVKLQYKYNEVESPLGFRVIRRH